MRFLFVIAFLLLLGCSEESGLGRPSRSTTLAAGSGGSSSSASGGLGGDGSGGSGASGQGGEGPVDGGTGGPAEAGASDPPCENDYAFWASGMSFSAPTPKPLALALTELAYDPASHPIAIVLAAKGGAASARLFVSATEKNGAGAQVFPQGKAPDFAPATLLFGGFESGAPQMKGYLRLVDMVGPIDIELSGVSVKVSTSSGCSSMLATLSAIIPNTEGGKTLHLSAGSSTIAELGGDGGGGGPKDPGEQSWEIRAIFAGETMSFDFTTLQ